MGILCKGPKTRRTEGEGGPDEGKEGVVHKESLMTEILKNVCLGGKSQTKISRT